MAQDLFVPCTAAAQGVDFTLVSGQQLVVRLVAVRVNASTREIEDFKFEEPMADRRWRALGCRMRLADHPYLQQALQRGIVLNIQIQTSGCLPSYEIGRDESLIARPATAPVIRTPSLTVAASGALAPHPPFTPVRGRAQMLTLIGTGTLTPRTPFTPVMLRIETLTVTGTGSR
jgi:hypothetical protein